MFLSPEELQNRLDDNRNLSTVRDSLIIERAKTELPRRSVGSGQPIPSQIHKIIAATAVKDDNQKAIANVFKISEAEVSRLVNGSRGNDEVKSVVDETRLKIIEKALSKSKIAIDHIDGDKLAKARPGELAAIALTLARTAETVEGKRNADDNRVQVIIHAPEQRKLKDYEVIDATPVK